jgi:hypothetical protein
MTTAPGWHADPAGRPFERFWDGNAWTDQTRPPRGQATFTFDPLSAPFRTADQRPSPWYQRKRFVVPAAIVGTLIIVGAIGAANQPAPKTTSAAVTASTTSASSADAPATVATPAVTRPSPATSAEHATAAKSTAAKPTRTAAPARRPKAPAATTTSNVDAGSFHMPNEVGSVLQTAQDDVQRVSGDPFFFTHSHDLLGDRFQILDRDWMVCSQNVPAGRTVSAVGHIDFGVVKLDETCP